WSPLREIVVGSVAGAVYPSYGPIAAANGDPRWLEHYQGAFVEEDLVVLADEQLTGLVEALEEESIVVQRPDPMPHNLPTETPFWRTRSGWNAANPRDLFMVVGDEIIECASPHRHRQYERMAYRSLLNTYASAGARWTSAPPPMLHDALYNHALALNPPARADDGAPCVLEDGQEPVYAIREIEPVWEAADFVRCDDVIVGIRSNVTNQAGFGWLRRHLGDRANVIELKTRCARPNHIDTTFVPLRPGVALVNAAWIDYDALPDALKSWTLIEAPEPHYAEDSPMASPYFTSQWLSMNVLSIDERRVFVDEQQTELIRRLESHGFEPMPLPFDAVGAFGGSFHCVTLDMRRD
ncbi:MAG: glycine amidinotransferase, partial [Bradymonadia bacterium]